MSGDLPGVDAHAEMVPGKRVSAYEAIKQNLSFRESAVAVIFCYCDDHYEVILIERTQYKGAHSGQIAFPGGKKETTDQNLIETAIRETQEEIQVKLSHQHFLGTLTPVYIPVSKFMVQPHLFVLEEMPEMFPQEREVAQIIPFQLDNFLNQSTIQYKDILIGDGRTLREVPFFNISGHTVWGATALVLNEIKVLLG